MKDKMQDNREVGEEEINMFKETEILARENIKEEPKIKRE